MPEVPTIQVYWPEQGKGVFQINEPDFDPKIHRRVSDKPETAGKTETTGDEESQTRAELVEAAEAKGITVKAGMTKADIQALLDLDSMSKAELVEMAKAKGLDATGTKADLISALGG